MLKWEYYEKNIGTNKPVAVLCNGDGQYILDVMENKKGYYTRSFKRYINPYFILYSEEISLSEQKQSDLNEHLKNRLLDGCKKIQENCEQQLKDLAKEINQLL